MGEQRHRSWQPDAAVIDVVKIWEDTVTKTGRQKAERREAGNWQWKETNLTKAKADPATRVDGLTGVGGGSGFHVEFPQIPLPIQGKSREISAAVKIG